MMKKLILLILPIILVFLIDVSCFSSDPSILWGRWETKGTKTKIFIEIKSNKEAYVKINDKILKNLEFKHCYCEGTTKYPFLSLFASENDQWFYIYLTIGSKKNFGEANILRGFYEFSIISKNDVEKGFSEPIELYKIENKNGFPPSRE